MIFGNDRNQLRKAYSDAWSRFQQGLPLQPIEQQIVTVIQEHPEYHNQINNLLTEFLPESGQSNPLQPDSFWSPSIHASSLSRKMRAWSIC